MGGVVSQGLQQLGNNIGQGVNAMGSNLAAGDNAIKNNANQLYQGAISGNGTPWGAMGQRDFSMMGNNENWTQPYKIGTDFVHGASKDMAQLDPLSYVNGPSDGFFAGAGAAPENYVAAVTNWLDNTANNATTNAVQGVTSGVSKKLWGSAAGQANNPFDANNTDTAYNGQKFAQQQQDQQAQAAQQASAKQAQALAQQQSTQQSNQASFNQANSLEDALRNAYLQRSGARANGNGFY